jgi:putative transposase
MQNATNDHSNDQALARYGAISWIGQAQSQGHSLGEALAMASKLPWAERYYSARTLEGWYYAHRNDGFKALQARCRSDKGLTKVFTQQAQEAILLLRREQPHWKISVLAAYLEKQGVLAKGTYSLSSIRRLLARHGLDRQALRAQAHNCSGPRKAFEMAHANELWMIDLMQGPTLSRHDVQTGKKKTMTTWLVGIIDDCSRLVPHAQFYTECNLQPVLDACKQAFSRRGLPDKLYSDHGKVFKSDHFRRVCAQLDIRLLHAKPYAAWSKGKIERFFLTLRQQFLAPLSVDPVDDLAILNQRFHTWLECEYHQRPHSALQGESPTNRFAQKILRLRPLPDNAEELFLAKTQRRVRTDATISIDGKLWEVPVHLKGARVEVRYDPFEYTVVEIFFQGIQAGLARPLDKSLNSKIYDSKDYARHDKDFLQDRDA